MGSTWGQPGVNLWLAWGQPGVDLHRPTSNAPPGGPAPPDPAGARDIRMTLGGVMIVAFPNVKLARTALALSAMAWV